MNQTYRRASGQPLKEPQAPAPPDFFKAETLATFSHELGSPLAAITGYASTLLRLGQQMDPEERQAFLQAIQDAGDRMHIILDHLLKVSQMEAGMRTAQFADVNLVSLVQEALAVAERNAKHNPPTQDTPPAFRFVLKNRLSEDQAVVRADGALLRDVLDNLLGNAIRYSPQGGQITVTLRHLRPKHPIGSLPAHLPLVALSVSDQGIGIAREHLNLIFERFYRVDTRLTRETGGLGLGLALCRRIAELHRGTIQVESTPGQGSTFHLLLPAVPPGPVQ
jgi:signal transduction histidine kinase